MHGNISGDADQRDWEEHACTSLILVASPEYRSQEWPAPRGGFFKKHYFKGYGVGVLKRFVFALHRAWVARFAVHGHVARPRSRYLFQAAPTRVLP